jgi:hypothetical protein
VRRNGPLSPAGPIITLRRHTYGCVHDSRKLPNETLSHVVIHPDETRSIERVGRVKCNGADAKLASNVPRLNLTHEIEVSQLMFGFGLNLLAVGVLKKVFGAAFPIDQECGCGFSGGVFKD